jgi:hypothetical protein
MCPACMATVALTVVGATSAGGIAALVMKTLHLGTRAKNATPNVQPEGETHGSPENRISN